MAEDISNWQGYLIAEEDSTIIIKSRFVIDHVHVFGPDSDFTTLAISALEYLSTIHTINSISVDSSINQEVLQACGYSIDEEAEWSILCHSLSAELCLTKNSYVDIELTGDEIDPEFVKNIQNAWIEEGSSVSQGAYVSKQSYDISSSSRMNLTAQQIDGENIWPPRESIEEEKTTLKKNLNKSGNIISWTKLAAGGAPSEFSIRAPLLGGISTVLVNLDDGPNGVFLLADDNIGKVEIGTKVGLVLRKIYAQDNYVKYGLKAITE